jgi:hypothetical protein
MSLADVQSLINSAQGAASDALTQAEQFAAAAQSAAATITSPGSSGSIVWTKPALIAPITANNDLGAAFLAQAANEFNTLGPGFQTQFQTFIATYFPNVSACLQANADNWICNMIVNGGNGIPQSVSDQIWQRARENVLKEVAATRDMAYNEWAARGFSLPVGALQARLMQIDQQRIDKTAELARETAIKNIEIQIENIRFAVKAAIEVRIAAARAAIDYVRQYLQAYENATERAKAMVYARWQFYGVINDYYRAVAAIESLDVEVKKGNVLNTYHDNELFVKAAAEGTKIRTDAAIAAAQALGQAAAAALGAQNTLAATMDTTTS